MYRKSLIRATERVVFDPANKQHRLDYARFLKYNNWKECCHYLLEDPYMDIPTMINDKLIAYFLAPLTEKV